MDGGYQDPHRAPGLGVRVLVEARSPHTGSFLKAGASFLKSVTGKFFRIRKIEASRNCVFNFLHTRQQNIVKIISTQTANFETHLFY